MNPSMQVLTTARRAACASLRGHAPADRARMRALTTAPSPLGAGRAELEPTMIGELWKTVAALAAGECPEVSSLTSLHARLLALTPLEQARLAREIGEADCLLIATDER